MVGIKWKDWNTIPTLPLRKPGQVVFVQGAEIFACDGHIAFADAFETGNNHEKGRLAGPARADETERLAGFDIQVYAP